MSDEPKTPRKRRPRKPDEPRLLLASELSELNVGINPGTTTAQKVRRAIAKGELNLPKGQYVLILVRDRFTVAEKPTVERTVTDG